jgi:guanine nucleotide-binding protein subunit alpha
MACCNNRASAEAARNAQIETELIADGQAQAKRIKLLLLGAGESGKSTIFKQMKIMNGGYNDDEARYNVHFMIHNIFTSMKTLVQAAEKEGLTLQPGNELLTKEIASYSFGVTPEPYLVQAVKSLWADPAIQRVFTISPPLDNSAIFFNDIDRITAPDFVATEQDILLTRVRTTGITEEKFTFNDTPFIIVDVGGQRNERRKWIHCFGEVTTVIFITAISEYDQTLREVQTQNRHTESLLLFDEIINSEWFKSTPIVLLLNKMDQFTQKIKTSPLVNYFPDYQGSTNPEVAADFIGKKFLALNKFSERPIYPHKTTALDTALVRKVFEAINDTLMASAVKDFADAKA